MWWVCLNPNASSHFQAPTTSKPREQKRRERREGLLAQQKLSSSIISSSALDNKKLESILAMIAGVWSDDRLTMLTCSRTNELQHQNGSIQFNNENFDGVEQYARNMLRRRQVKVETDTWEQAVKDYKGLLIDMCEQKLAPDLPYMKSFLGWFEPMRDAIAKEEEWCRSGKNRTAYSLYFN